jgi:hypothetical protein
MSTLKTRLSALKKKLSVKPKLSALKHGVFAKTAILPGEDPQEFKKLHAAVVAEWRPNGPTQDDCVLTIAQGIWSKARLQKFLHATIEACVHDPGDPLFDEGRALAQFYFVIQAAPDEFYQALSCLSKEHADHLRENFFQEKFKSNSEWLEATRNEIYRVMLPKADRLQPPDDFLLCRSAHVASPDVLEKIATTSERIDATIDRAIKRLIQAKAMKQMMGTLPPSGAPKTRTKASSLSDQGARGTLREAE